MSEFGETPGQRAYLLVKSLGCHVEKRRKLKGMVLHVTHPDRPGEAAEAFGYAMYVHDDGELAAWEALGMQLDSGDFWYSEPS